MTERFSECLDQARELVDTARALIDLSMTYGSEQALRAPMANRIYAMINGLQTLLATNILGSPECNDAMDELYEAEDGRRESAIGRVKDLRMSLIEITMRAFNTLTMDSQSLSHGRLAMTDLLLLLIATLQRIETDLDPAARQRQSWSRDFHCARRYALVATEEQRTMPIEELSVHALFNALYAVYAITPSAVYSEEMERYAGCLLRRALDLLLTPAGAAVFNIHAYRMAISGSTTEFRFSSRMLRDITLVWHALSDYFDMAHLLPIEVNPRTICQPTRRHFGLARDWLRRHAVDEIDVWVRDQLVNLSMRAGEMDLFHADHRAQHSAVHLVLREHRTADYYVLMETAPMPSKQVVLFHLLNDAEFNAKGPYAQRESLHVSLVILSTFMARLKASQKNLDPAAYVVLWPELRKWSVYIRQNPQRPILLLMFNHVQLWFNGRVLMYNSALEAVCAWMIIVEEQCERRLDRHSVATLLDAFLWADETPASRVARLAALNSDEPPLLGSSGRF